MAVICPELKLLFLCVPRTASTSISEVLINQFNGQWLPPHHIRNIMGKIVVDYKHTTYRQVVEKKLTQPAEMKGYTKIAFTRNPYDWLVSDYCWKKACYATLMGKPTSHLGEAGNMPTSIAALRSKLKKRSRIFFDMLDAERFLRYRRIYHFSFEEYCRLHLSRQGRSVYQKFVEGGDVRILKYENLQSEIRHLFMDLGVQNIPAIPVVNSVPRERYQEYYTGKLRDMVWKAYKKDFDLFGYRFEKQADYCSIKG